MPRDDEQGAGHVVEGDDGVMILAIHVRVMVWREVELVEISYGSLASCEGFQCSASFFAFL